MKQQPGGQEEGESSSVFSLSGSSLAAAGAFATTTLAGRNIRPFNV
jgi:hypothetical protein